MPRRAVMLCGIAGLIGLALGSAIVTDAQTQTPRAIQGGRGGQSFTVNPSETPTTGTGAVSGVVTDGATGQPLQGALVQLFGPIVPSGDGGRGISMQRPRQRTDSRGRFIFTRLPAGDAYTVNASRQGYFDGGHRSRPGSTGGSRIDLREGDWFAKADIALWKPAAISGIVRDERGEPLVGVTVQPLLELMVGGIKRYALSGSAITDDRGAYRVANLRPGRYLVQVPNIQVTLPDGTASVGSLSASAQRSAPPLNLIRSSEDGNQSGLSVLVGYSFPTPPPGHAGAAYPPTYHPSARSVDLAERVTLEFAEQRSNVDVQLALVPSRRVSGRVVGQGGAMANLPVRLLPLGSEGAGEGAETGVTITDDQGEFDFVHVPVGDYAVIAGITQTSYSAGSVPAATRSMLPERAGFFTGGLSSGVLPGTDNMRFTIRTGAGTAAIGRAEVSVGDRDVTDVTVSVQGGVGVSGHFLWDGSQTPPADFPTLQSVNMEPANGDLALGLPFTVSRVNDSSPIPVPFSIRSVLPGRYLFRPNPLSGGYVLESVQYGGHDLLSVPLEIVSEKDITGVVIRYTKRPMSISGVVRSSAMTVADTGAVMFFPADASLWRDAGTTAPRFATATVASSGAYRITSLPPGDYYAVAVADADRHRILDLEFLQTLITQAPRITLAPGSEIKQDLRMAVIKR